MGLGVAGQYTGADKDEHYGVPVMVEHHWQEEKG